MGLSDALARSAAGHAHVLVAEMPGSWRTRAAVERAVLDRGWRLASSPADADVLVVCGALGPRLTEAVDLVWHQLPGPRVRLAVQGYDDVAGRLDEARAGLLDTAQHRHDAQHRPAAPDLLPDDHGDGDHGDMDDGDMEMAPGGIPLAEGGEDRDGLEMDVLTVRLGPLLPHWPAGLVLHCSLQGDVVTEARAEVLDESPPAPTGPADRARSIDSLVSLLALAGWDDAAAQARRLRDAALRPDGDTPAAVAEASAAHLRRRVRRSWLLRWSLRGVRPVADDEAAARGLPADAAGDTYDRLLRLLDRATGQETASDDGRAFTTGQLADLATGLDLATARLVVASLDVHSVRAVDADQEVSHG